MNPTGKPRRSSPRAALLRMPPSSRARMMCSSASLMVPFTCCLTHTVQVAQLADPALGPGRGRLPDVLFGRLPSLHALRRRLLALVRTLRRYYATVRLPTGVHVGLLAHGLLQPARHRLGPVRKLIEQVLAILFY